MREKLAWALFVLLLIVGAYGFLREGLNPSEVWAPEGWRRFAVLAIGFGAWTLGFRLLRPGLLVPATVLVAGLYGICWAGFTAVLGPLFFVGSCWLLGTLLAPCARSWMPVLLGLAAWIFLISIAVHFSVHTRYVYGTALALPYIFGWKRARECLRNLSLPTPATTASALLAFILLAHFLVALKPETGADALAMHLAAPELIAHDGRWDFDYTRFTWALLPMGADWAYTAGYMLGGETGTRLLNFAMLVLLTLLIREMALRWVPDNRATLAAALFASTPLVQLVTGSLFVENMWAVMIAGAVVALLDGELVWVGVLVGTGMAIKFGTAAFLGPIALTGIAIAFRDRKLRQGLAGLGFCVLLAAPTYVTAWHKTGNPAYPYLNHIFKAPSFETQEVFQETRFRQPLTWATPYNLTFRSPQYIEGDKGGMGFQYFLLVLPAALFIRRRSQAVLFGIAACAAITICLSQPNLRYLYPVLALLSTLIALLPQAALLTAVAALNIAFLPAAGYYHREFALPTRADAERYLEVGHPQRKLIAWLNANAPGEPAAFFGGNPIAGFYGRAYTDQWHSHPYAPRLPGWSKTAEMRREWQRLGIRYVVAPASGLTRYPVVNELLRPLSRTPLAISGRFAIFLLPEPAPEADRPSPIIPPGTFDSPHDSMEFIGAWSHLADFQEALNGTISYSNQKGSALSVRFTGTGIDYRYTSAPNRGIARIVIDGMERSRLDLYSPDVHWRQSWRVDDLDPGAHSIEIQVTGERNPSASDFHVDVDQLTVTGARTAP